MSTMSSPAALNSEGLRAADLVRRAIPIIREERNSLFDGHQLHGELLILDQADENAKAAIWEMDTWIAEAESYLSALAANATKARVLAEAFGRDSHGNIINAEANAHLISAAPDMYEALKLARDCIWTGGDTISTLAKIDAALSKALGSPDPARSVDEQGRGTAA